MEIVEAFYEKDLGIFTLLQPFNKFHFLRYNVPLKKIFNTQIVDSVIKNSQF